ncbi:MAG TPA: thioredoxin family protein [Gaiellaceae bacterium]|nr:thioredoxin family protein [Gaiellaceae bacterium]
MSSRRDMSSRRGTALERCAPGLTLVFVGRRQSGVSRRMESLVAWVKVTQKKRLRVVEVDADRHPGLVEQLAVTEVPTLLLVEDRRVVGRLEGRATGRQIDDLIRPHLAA